MIDHLIVCVGDLDGGARNFRDRFGLDSVEGGPHPGHGTANRIVPLGSSYIELVAVVDRSEADASPFGRWVSGRVGSAGVDAVSIRTDDLSVVCTRLDLESTTMSRQRPDGVELKWSVAGVDLAFEESLPFFIEWHVPQDQMPGRADVIHDREVTGVEQIVLNGDRARLTRWTEDVPNIRCFEGAASVVSVSLATPEGPLHL
ncbi:MAG: VOC family protein [Acidimicrobiia bacterium]